MASRSLLHPLHQSCSVGIGLHIAGRHQPHGIAKFADRVRPVVGVSASLQSDEAWFDVTKELQHPLIDVKHAELR